MEVYVYVNQITGEVRMVQAPHQSLELLGYPWLNRGTTLIQLI